MALCAFRGANRIDILNLTAGMYFELGRSSNLLLGAVVPLRNVFDRTFDAELAVYYNFMR